MNVLWRLSLLVLALAGTQAEQSCREVKLISKKGKEVSEKASKGKLIVSMTIKKEFTKNKCIEGDTYRFSDSRAFASGNCKAKFEICEDKRTTPAPLTTSAKPPIIQCKTRTLWSEPGKVEATVVKARKGGVVKVVSLTLKTDFSGLCDSANYYFSGNRVFVANGCDGRFVICYIEEVPTTTPVPLTTQSPELECKIIKLWAAPGETEKTVIKGKDGEKVVIKTLKLVEEISDNICNSKTFKFIRNLVIVKNGCDGRFEVCYMPVVTTPVPLTTTEAPGEFCKKVALWSRVGKTEKTEINARNGGVVTVVRLTLLREFSDGICDSSTYYFRKNGVFVRNGCEGRFEICYTEEVESQLTTQKPTPPPCRYVNMRSTNGQKVVKKPKKGLAIVSFELVTEFSKYKCVEGVTYGFKPSEAYVKNYCEGKFKICEEPE